MQTILAGEQVRLTEDFPALELYRGDVGLVRETWFYPNAAYDVEFGRGTGSGAGTCRVLLLDDQVAPVDPDGLEQDDSAWRDVLAVG